MNFDYNEEQQLLADSVRRFLAKDYAFEARKKIVASRDGWSPAVWSTIAEMGLTGLPFSPDYGGFGGGAVDLMGVMEAAGDALLVEPYLATVGLGAQFVARTGSDAQKKSILPAVVEGKLKMAFAHTEKGARYNLAKVETPAKKAGSGWQIAGEKVVVLGAPAADKLVVSAKTDRGLSLFLVDKNSAKIKAYVTLDEQRAGDVSFSRAQVPRGFVSTEAGQRPPTVPLLMRSSRSRQGSPSPSVPARIVSEILRINLNCFDFPRALSGFNQLFIETLRTRG